MKKELVTIVGSYNVGLFLKGNRLPAIGETITADNFIEGAGGKGSNQAIAASRFGVATRFIGRLGADNYGRDALALYCKHGIPTENITIDDTIHSGISIILIDQAGKNMISVALGANLNLSREDLDRAGSVIQDSSIVGFQLENKLETVLYGIRTVHEMGITTFLDPAPAVPLPDTIYSCIDIIKPNETEASILTGIEVKDIANAKLAGTWFLEKGVRTAIITLGERGSVLVTQEMALHIPGLPVDAIDTTGAGDIFSGAFLSEYSKGGDLENAILFANAAAALSTRRLGVIESIPAQEDVNQLLKQENTRGMAI
jgi:ribokinase